MCCFMRDHTSSAPLRFVALYRTRSAAIFGIDAHPIDVEVDMYPSGIPERFRHGRDARHGRPGEPRADQVGAHQLRIRLSKQRRDHQSGAGKRQKRRCRVRFADGARDSGRDGCRRVRRQVPSARANCRSTGVFRPVRGCLPVAACARQTGNRKPDRAGGECCARRLSSKVCGSSGCRTCLKWSAW